MLNLRRFLSPHKAEPLQVGDLTEFQRRERELLAMWSDADMKQIEDAERLIAKALAMMPVGHPRQQAWQVGLGQVGVEYDRLMWAETTRYTPKRIPLPL